MEDLKDEETKEIRYADLFGGVGGFRLGIERATTSSRELQNLQEKSSKSNNQVRMGEQQPICRCVFYNDNDKYAVQTYNKNFKENHKATDIRTIKTKDIPRIDMLCGGFPCQAFSIAGKRKGFEDTRGTMFYEIARIIKAKRPRIVLLENVKGLLSHDRGRTFAVILATLEELGYDVQWMVLNSKFFGVPQNRERVFIIASIRGTSRPEILPFREISSEINQIKQQVSSTICSQYYKCPRDQQYIDASQGQRIRNTEGVAQTLQGQAGGQGAKTGLYAVQIPTNTKLGYDVAEAREDGIRLQYEQSKTARGRVVKGASQAIQANSTPGVLDKMSIRRLTPTECERLQGFPDGWTEGVSDTQRYKQMGNAVTVNVIEAIARKLLK